MQITAVEVLHVEGPAPDRPLTYRQHRMLHHYAEHALTTDWGQQTPTATESAHYLRIRAGDELGLYGPIDRPAAEVVVNELRDFLLGKDPPMPANGRVPVGTAPGFGIELDDSKISRTSVL